MVFYKKAELKEQKLKYGAKQKGLFALERIESGERVWKCDCGEKDPVFTRQQLFDIITKHPRLDNFVHYYSYMVDDDLYAMPITYSEEKNNDECAYFNHSCNPNCGLCDDGFGDAVIAIRDIQPGEELTYHYGTLETEMSLINGLECKCYSTNCSKILRFDNYRDPEFVAKYYNYFSPYMKQKVNDMKDRWYSGSCYVKRFPSPYINQVEEWKASLCSAKSIKKGELLASFSSLDILERRNFFCYSTTDSNCQIIDRDVFANCDIPAENQLSLFKKSF